MHHDGGFVLEIHGLSVRYRCLCPECANEQARAIGTLPAHVTSTSLDVDRTDLTEFDALAPSRIVGGLRQQAEVAARQAAAAAGQDPDHIGDPNWDRAAGSGNSAARRWFREYIGLFFFPLAHPPRTIAEVTYADNRCNRMSEYFVLTEMDFKSKMDRVEAVAASYILEGTKYKTLYNLWLGEIAARTTVHSVRVVPASRDLLTDDPEKTGRRVLNSFTCFPYVYDPEFTVDLDVIDPVLEHVREVWCRGDAGVYQYVLRWFAHIVQRPEMKESVGTALLIRGAPGSGKNIVFELIRKFLLLTHSVAYTQGVEKICQRFNSFMEGKLLLILDEVTAQKPDGSYDDKIVDALKSIITQLTAGVEKKFLETQQTMLPCRLVVLTNHTQPLPIGPEDRRWLPLELGPELLGDQVRKQRLVDACSINGPATALHLFHHLMRIDVTEFGRERPPRTQWRANLEHPQ